ncbi:MAG TPA: isoprenylcysteine carboxylmethyltransferase family protein [Thiobacillaceae bacterium]|nr:isoprenylcysteine carboxylmethyltransferase family protein [Thiobacillaceae bacterium]HNU64746.1 isoprenylcysteine carboxylmethyltransferase family protein [Thiobacillaceae bacterium]
MHDPARRPATLVLPPLPYALALYVSWRLDRDLWPWPFSLGSVNDWLGWCSVGMGLALFAWALSTFWRHHTTVNPYKAASNLVQDGPFRLSRNPIYVGDWLIYLGVMLLLRTLWPLAFAPLVWIIIRFGVIRHEERHLEARFGAEYRQFKARVRRWL